MSESAIDIAFLKRFKELTEDLWQDAPIAGFQSPKGARWNPGLTNEQIITYQSDLGVRFPDDFKQLLCFMNGTYYPEGTIDIFAGHRRRPPAYIYSYPRDLDEIRERISELELPDALPYIQESLDLQGYTLNRSAGLVPIFGYSFLVCDLESLECPVLSIVGTDAYLYASNLREYLVNVFLPSRLRGLTIR